MNQYARMLVPLLAGFSAFAAEPTQSTGTTPELSLEDLVNIKVTSVSKKETNLESSPAAIYVITQDDIRQSGLTSIPELLRMVPGLNVARVDGSQWAISSRGFNGQFANKLLVLVDGRAVYTPTFGGVFWNAQDVVLENLDRIEVIRGPGASLWGANAVNGVINITTKSAKETQGGLISTSVGTEDQPSTTVQYGGQLATNVYYRVYVKYFNREGLVDSAGRPTPDDWRSVRSGARLDWEPSPQGIMTVQGSYYDNVVGGNIHDPNLTPPLFFQSVNLESHNSGGNVLGRWTQNFSETSQLTLQIYFDHLKQEYGFTTVLQDTFDVDLQHRFSLGPRNDIVWGAGYRLTAAKVAPTFFAVAAPESRHFSIYNAFVQDDLTVVSDRLHLILGAKVEHNEFTGWEFQPNARLLWTPSDHQTVWAAASRAYRTPSIADRDVRANVFVFQPSPLGPPVVASSLGNQNLEPEELTSYELGYRIEPNRRISLDAALFYNVYRGLIRYDPGSPYFDPLPSPHVVAPVTAHNSQSAETMGAELAARWQVTGAWRLEGSYTLLQMRVRPDSVIETESPQQQFQIRSSVDLPHHLEWNAVAYFVDQTTSTSGTVRQRVPAYLRLDVGVTWRPIPSLEIGLWGQNLLDNHHPEFNTFRTSLQTEVPRGVLGKITWHF